MSLRSKGFLSTSDTVESEQRTQLFWVYGQDLMDKKTTSLPFGEESTGGALLQLRAVLGIARALSSVSDEAELLQLIAESVCDCLNFGLCVVAMLEPDNQFHIRAVATRSREPVSPAIWNHTLPMDEYERIKKAADCIGKILWLDGRDPLVDELLDRGLIVETPTAVSSSQWHSASLLLAPLEAPDGSISGILSPDDPLDGRLPSEEGSIVIETLTYLAGAAIELVRSRTNAAAQVRILEAQRQQITRLFEASTAVNKEVQLDGVLGTVVRTMAEAGGFARVALYLIEPGSERLVVRATFGLTDDEDRRLRDNPLERDVFAPLMRPEMRVSRSYLFDHRRFELPDALLQALSLPESVNEREDGRWSALDSLNIPMYGVGEELLGVISIDEPVDGMFPDASHVEALEFFADQCAAAVSQVLHYRHLTIMAETDPLTQLPNRRTFMSRLILALRSAEEDGKPLAVLFLDLDHFKAVNDNYGHMQGDRVLRTVAKKLRGELRQTDLLARFGGEEFVVILPATYSVDALAVAEHLRQEVASLMIPFGRALVPSPTISIGLASSQKFTTERHVGFQQVANTLLKSADKALYEAKELGRNRIVMASLE